MRKAQVVFIVGMLTTQCLINCTGQANKQNADMPEIQNKKSKIIGGGCDGCELMFVGMPKEINSIDTSAGWKEKGQRLLVTGIIYYLDGKTPAPNVIVYYWQTDNNGYYSPQPAMEQAAVRHGHIRGWIKTDRNGKYAIHTIRPAPYPNDAIPAHIHFSIKESDIENEYYIDDLNFDDDKLLIPYFKKYPQENRGGSGVVRLLQQGNIQIAEHDLVLGLNIPNYPKTVTSKKQSGLSIGEDQPSFIPFHAFGPDKGTQTCPVCKYGRYHGIVYFVGNHPNWDEVKKWLVFLEQESTKRQKYLKAYFVYGNEKGFDKVSRQNELNLMGVELNVKRVALTFVPSFSDTSTEVNLNRINPEVENTFIVYKQRSIIDKYVELKPTQENLRMLSETLDKTRGDYFDLPDFVHE